MKTKITPSDLRAEAARLIAVGQMPDLSTLLDVGSQVRGKYCPKILEARRQATIHVVKSGEKK
jgi:hypothetical protein